MLILQKDLEKSSYKVGSDAVITRTTSENIKSELADHYHITRMYSPAAYLAD
jgi:hypothetical protein